MVSMLCQHFYFLCLLVFDRHVQKCSIDLLSGVKHRTRVRIVNSLIYTKKLVAEDRYFLGCAGIDCGITLWNGITIFQAKEACPELSADRRDECRE